MFKRHGVHDFSMYWTVIAFQNGMIEVKINEMGNSDQLFIAAEDITKLSQVNDLRYNQNK
jgi:hypothetical protein